MNNTLKQESSIYPQSLEPGTHQPNWQLQNKAINGSFVFKLNILH